MAAEILGVGERTVQRHYAQLLATKPALVTVVPYNPEEHVRGAIPFAFGLTDAGVRKALQDGFVSDSTKSFDERSKRTVEHEIAISRIHLDLVRLADRSGWDLRWRQVNLDKDTVRPDALFYIDGSYFFLEVERAKLGNYRDGVPSVLRKLAAYLSYFDSQTCENDFGFRRFYVATVMRTMERSRNLVRMMQQPPVARNPKKQMSPLDNDMFLVSSEANPLVFVTAKNNSRVSLDAILPGESERASRCSTVSPNRTGSDLTR